MKEYNFKEVIANIQDGDTYKCTEKVWVVTTISKEEGSIKFNNGDGIHHGGINDQQLFVKVEKPVNFMECVHSDKRCKVEYYRLDDLIEEDTGFQWLKSYQNLDDILNVLSKEFNTIAFKEFLINGKWYLEE